MAGRDSCHEVSLQHLPIILVVVPPDASAPGRKLPPAALPLSHASTISWACFGGPEVPASGRSSPCHRAAAATGPVPSSGLTLGREPVIRWLSRLHGSCRPEATVRRIHPVVGNCLTFLQGPAIVILLLNNLPLRPEVSDCPADPSRTAESIRLPRLRPRGAIEMRSDRCVNDGRAASAAGWRSPCYPACSAIGARPTPTIRPRSRSRSGRPPRWSSGRRARR